MWPSIGLQVFGSCWCQCFVAVCLLQLSAVSTVGWAGRSGAKAGTRSESCATNRVGSFRRKGLAGDGVSAIWSGMVYSRMSMWPGGRYELGRLSEAYDSIAVTARGRDSRQEQAPAKLQLYRGATHTITKAKPAPNCYRTASPVQLRWKAPPPATPLGCEQVKLSGVWVRFLCPVLPASQAARLPGCLPPCLHPATHGTPEAEQGCRAPRSFGQIV